MSSERDDHGVSHAVRNSPLAELLDTPMDDSAPRHLLRTGRVRRDAPWCGADSQRMTKAADGVTCPTCKPEATVRLERGELALLRSLAKSPCSIRACDRETRQRLAAKKQLVVIGAGVHISDLGRIRLENER